MDELGPVTHVHIGMEKTGTTTIQAFLARNRRLLAEHGTLFPEVPGAANHLKLSAYAQADDKMDDTRRRYVADLADLPQFRADLEEELAHEAAAFEPDVRTVLLSNEHLSARLQTAEEVDRLVQLLARVYGQPVRAVVYLREQTSNLLSSYSTELRHGRTSPPLPADLDMDKLDYHRRLAPWAEVLGHERLDVRLFHRTSFVDGDLLRDFMDAVGHPWPQGARVPDDHNRSLDATGLEFLRVFNIHAHGILEEEQLRDLRWRLAIRLEELGTRPRLRLHDELEARVRAAVAESNARVAREYFGRDDLFPDPLDQDDPDEVVWSPLSAAGLMHQFVELWASLSHD